MLSVPAASIPPEEAAWNTSVLEALRVVQVVREYDKAQIGKLLGHLRDSGRTEGVLVALAALVPDDQPVSSLLGWIDDDEVERKARRPWERDAYPPCNPDLDRSPRGTSARHGSPSRYNAGCRGEGCSLARHDYDCWYTANRRKPTA